MYVYLYNMYVCVISLTVHAHDEGAISGVTICMSMNIHMHVYINRFI